MFRLQSLTRVKLLTILGAAFLFISSSVATVSFAAEVADVSVVDRSAATAEKDTLIERVKALPGVSDVKAVETGPFNEKYVLFYEQPIDHKNPSLGTFKQRLFLMNFDFSRPTIIITEGYGAQYGAYPIYPEELSRLFQANVILVEHRYFYESNPEGAGWEHMNAENSAHDHHRVRQLFGEFYKGKWIATGISKGGQTALIYRSYFPDDVDVTVPYVAPLCKGREDGRHEPFLKTVPGSAEERARLEAFQIELLKRRGEIAPLFNKMVEEKGYKYNLPLEEVYDFAVLEYPFAFWQMGYSPSSVPSLESSSQEIYDHWMSVSPADYFVTWSPTSPFFVQAAKELGYYGYDTKPFKGLLAVKSTKGYLSKIFLPSDYNPKFDRSLYKRLKRFVKRGEERMLFVYGEYDPWSAVMINEPKSENIVVFVEPGGSHRARIGTLPQEMQEEALEILKRWLEL